MYKCSEAKQMVMQKIFDNFGLHGLIIVMAVVIGIFRSIS